MKCRVFTIDVHYSVQPESCTTTTSRPRTVAGNRSTITSRTGTDYTPFSLQPNDEFGIPLLELSSSSDDVSVLTFFEYLVTYCIFCSADTHFMFADLFFHYHVPCVWVRNGKLAFMKALTLRSFTSLT